ncbi:MAG: nicotinate-nucleotide--dimethylbenzimidazole phosphoribosyltransferase, partial [Clostridia bacterium]|nr:nicotinate-nucleotide--dimethylbenzimidazole phosphoribosyltransferase [Clostridia bacterium]
MRIPAVADGFISIVAALAAVKLCSNVRDFLFLSHASTELGYVAAAKELRLEPFLALDMRLGEGSGCPLAFEVIKAANAVMSDMATFDEASIDDGYLEKIRSGR